MSDPLFSKKNLKLLSDPLNSSNPITVQVLGICSALAVTAQLKPAIVMAISVTIVVALGNVIISLLRKLIKDDKERLFFFFFFVVAANAGCSWSPFGDVTTTMLWIGRQVISSYIIFIKLSNNFLFS